MIHIEAISKAYEGTTVLSDISVTLPRGSISIIVGENGSGKSTLLSIIGRFLKQSGGSVTFDGADYATLDLKDFAKKVASLRQSNQTLRKISVREFVSFARFVHHDKTLRAEDHEAIDRSIEKMGCNDYKNRYLHTLSGGQLQRVYLAAIFAQDTDYILLDEPLNNLDIKHSYQLMSLIKRTAQEDHKTVVITMHDMNMALRYGDYALGLKKGNLVHHGAIASFANPDILNALFDLEFEILRKGSNHYIMVKEDRV